MRKINNTVGEAVLLVVVVLALLGGGILILRPKATHGESRRASASTEATAKLEAATIAQASAAAAGVTKIGEANAVAPASPSKDFITREIPSVLSKLPAPDPMALLEAEKRRSAVMEGRAEEAGRLYEFESKRSAQLQKERDAALAARREADQAIAEAAAANRAIAQQRALCAIVAILFLLGWGYTKFFSITPASLGRIAADVRGGQDVVSALDTHLAPWLHRHVNKARKLATDPDSKKP